MNFNALLQRLKAVEGFRADLYPDSGGWAIGYGRNLTYRPLTKDEADYLLQSDVIDCTRQLQLRLAWFTDLDTVRQEVLVEMAYNLGIGGLMKFKRMLAAAQSGDYTRAALEIADSEAARTLPKRYADLSRMMRTGERA